MRRSKGECGGLVVGWLLCGWLTASVASAGQILLNGDFEATPVLGPGQTGPAGGLKWTTTGLPGPNYLNSISGIPDWVYSTPEWSGTHTDVGLGLVGGQFNRPSAGQVMFNNRWNKLVSQTVTQTFAAGDVLTATVDFGTLGSSNDSGRAGSFYLVAGGVSPGNTDNFATGAIVLDSLSVANATWQGFVPDVVAPERQFKSLRLQYTFQPNDPALLLPVTVAMRLVTGSHGTAYWDNVYLTRGTDFDPNSDPGGGSGGGSGGGDPNQGTDPDPNPPAVPEPGTVGLALLGLAGVMSRAMRRRGCPNTTIASARPSTTSRS